MTHITFHAGVGWALFIGMTDDNDFEELASRRSEEPAPPAVGGAARQTPAVGEPGRGRQKPNEIQSLVLLIHTILGGLGTLYATTQSTKITLAAALLVLLITVVVLVVRHVVTPDGGPGLQGEDSRGDE
ncbi:hypothetical protein ACFWUW_27750 [Streptomyces sp. NPDC058655]|uniref:hypothetical protein n=1 Tax=Streptomyces sp. NPDC058655 TaxID=3346577 RepID=UPI00365BC6F3